MPASPSITVRPRAGPLPAWLLIALLAVAVLWQGLGAIASGIAGPTHRHVRAEKQLQLFDFRRGHAMPDVAVHVAPARHHHGPRVAGVVRTVDDQAADRTAAGDGDTLDGPATALHPAMLPSAAPTFVLAAAMPLVARPPWAATNHRPALPDRPPRTVPEKTIA